MSATTSDLKRRFALFDEVAELPPGERAAWFVALQISEPEHVSAVQAMLDELNQSSSHPEQSPSLIGVSAREFEAQVDVAASPDIGASVNAGDVVGPWQLERKIGEGGMGAVWLAARRDGNFDGHAAIKFLRTGLGKTELVDRFLRERRLLARLTHPGIARLLDAGTHQAEPYLVMEYIDGVPITDWAGGHAPQLAQRIGLLLKVCRATEYAHGQLIVHRDIKPSNVVVSHAGEPALLDFGIAKLMDDVDPGGATSLTHLTGRGFTLGYCAPEQVTGEATGVAADVFSLGVLAFELITGTMPFAGENRTALEHAIVHTEAKSIARALQGAPSSVAGRPTDAARAQGDLDAIVAKALRKNPADRYPTVGAFAADLERWLNNQPVEARRGNWHYKTRLWLRRNRLVATLASVAFLAISAGLVVALWQTQRAQQEAQRATQVADYLGELIQSASPDNHGGSWPTVLALLEQSEKDLATKFADDPKTHALLLARLIDTNDALNRDVVALGQLQQLQHLLAQTESPDSDESLDTLKHTAQILRRLNRNAEAMAIEVPLLPKFAARYGAKSEEYGRLLQGHSSSLAGVGRMQEAKERLVQGAAIMTKLYPNDLAKRIDVVNDSAVLLAQQALWREALDTLATIEGDLPALASKGGQKVRDALIMRGNLEAMRIRLGRYEGVEVRLTKIISELETLLGKNNPLVIASTIRLQNLACETGRFQECLTTGRGLLARLKEPGTAPDALLNAELWVLSQEGRMGLLTPDRAKVELQRMLAAAPPAMPGAGAERADFYRRLSDAAAGAGQLNIADSAQALARSDLAGINNANPESVAAVNRTAALTAYLRGQPKRALELLQDRFAQYEKSAEGDSPRRATLWLQRALFESEFDPTAATQSLAQSKAMFARLGGPQPQWKALLVYVELRISPENASPAALRAAEDAVDLAFARPRPAPWRAPTMPSL
ncbi:MAG: serine/threonine protein kinase [Rhodoferax sp.]|nr:serine/threonine protein kinase [Rhodoferax sp.]